MCLKSLWYCAEAYHQPDASKMLLSYFPRTLASPEIIRLIRIEKDPVAHVIRRCFEALVISKVAACIRSRTHSNVHISDEELVCLSAILGTERRDIMHCLKHPGAIELMNIVFLASGDIGSSAPDTVSPYILDVVPQTFSTHSQALPAEINTVLGLDQIFAPGNILNGQCELIPSSHYCLKMCIRDCTYNR